MRIILKVNIMQTEINFNIDINETTENIDLWEAFKTHLDSTYFTGASETLENQLIAFEYEAFKNNYVA